MLLFGELLLPRNQNNSGAGLLQLNNSLLPINALFFGRRRGRYKAFLSQESKTQNANQYRTVPVIKILPCNQQSSPPSLHNARVVNQHPVCSKVCLLVLVPTGGSAARI
mmetsp:Transcript_2012/g.5351  ORF Transcript_2012/g.5351 Transcript_2012/m.5351 type:complete len:109 (-) Transcript_2012:229-555(-)